MNALTCIVWILMILLLLLMLIETLDRFIKKIMLEKKMKELTEESVREEIEEL